MNQGEFFIADRVIALAEFMDVGLVENGIVGGQQDGMPSEAGKLEVS